MASHANRSKISSLRTAAVGIILHALSFTSSPAHVAAPRDDAALCGFLQIQRQFHHALDHCDSALRQDPSNADIFSNRGSANLSLGNFESALADFSRSIEERPSDASNYFNRALVHAATEQHHQAIGDYTKALELMPSLAIAYNNRGLAFEKLGERDKAVADFRAALAIAPNLKLIENNLRGLGATP